MGRCRRRGRRHHRSRIESTPLLVLHSSNRMCECSVGRCRLRNDEDNQREIDTMTNALANEQTKWEEKQLNAHGPTGSERWT